MKLKERVGKNVDVDWRIFSGNLEIRKGAGLQQLTEK